MTEIRFYRATGPHGYLSNLYLAPIEFDGYSFACAETAYQWGKPNKIEIAQWLKAAPTASLCAQAAHALFVWQVWPDWADRKVPRMRAVLRAKFDQHPDLKRQLLATGDATLIEESTTDAFWGTGKRGNGQNMLGRLLMSLRDEYATGRDEEDV